MPTDEVTDAIERAISRHPRRAVSDPTLLPAGVMMLLSLKDGEYCILLNKRSEYVEHHKGEIGFPGGSVEHSDSTLEETALRETWEELGVAPRDVTVLGALDDVATHTGYVISPYVGVIPSKYGFTPNIEVAEVFEVPLSAFFDAANHRDEMRWTEDDFTHTPAYAYQGRLIYGATAKVLERFLEILQSAPDEEAPWKK